MLELNRIYPMNCCEGLSLIEDKSIDTCVSSPPYWSMRDYGIESSIWPEVTYAPMVGMPAITVESWKGCLGLEQDLTSYIGHIVYVYRAIKRVLKDEGTAWVNLGDTYSRNIKGIDVALDMPYKNLLGIPWRVALALQADGWYLRSDIIWNKTTVMPEFVKDRPTRAHEYIFLISKSPQYYYDYEAIKDPISAYDNQSFRVDTKKAKGNSKTFRGGGSYTNGNAFNNSSKLERESSGNQTNTTGLRNKRTVWSIAPEQFKQAHFATFPPKLIEPCILAGAPREGIVLDPFMGSGTVAAKAIEHGRNYIGFEINKDYVEMAKKTKLKQVQIKLDL